LTASVNANFKATLNPVAFLKFEAGAGIGTGWDVGFIGLAINDKGNIEPQNFGGVVYRAWVAGTFQFDLAASCPASETTSSFSPPRKSSTRPIPTQAPTRPGCGKPTRG
jgi:hypothetical protein